MKYLVGFILLITLSLNFSHAQLKSQIDFPNDKDENINLSFRTGKVPDSVKVHSSKRMDIRNSGRIKEEFSAITEPMYLMDSIISKSDKGEFIKKQYFEYDAKGNESLQIIYNSESPFNAWKPQYRYKWIYDEANNYTFFQWDLWDVEKNDWIPWQKWEHEYANADYYLSASYYYWNELDEKWEGDIKYEYDYLTYGKRTEYREFSWDNSSDEWLNSEKNIRVYNSEENWMETKYYTWDLSDSNWDFYKWSKITRDQDYLRTTSLYLVWDSSIEDWVNSYKFEYVNEAKERKYGEYSTWEVSELKWTLSWKYYYDYDEMDNEILYETYYLDFDTNEWLGNNREENLYDKDNRMILSVPYEWDGVREQWIGKSDYYKTEYVYDGHEEPIFTLWSLWNIEWDDWSGIDKSIVDLGDNEIPVGYTYWTSVLDSKEWTSVEKREFFYTDFGEIDYELSIRWDELNLDWFTNYSLKKDNYYTFIKGTQEIQFPDFDEIYFPSSDILLAGSTSSELPISYTSSNQDVAVVQDNILKIIGPGETTISAIQEGNEEYEAALPVSQILIVNEILASDVKSIMSSDIYLFPNPTNETFQISNGLQGGLNFIGIYNIDGGLLMEFDPLQKNHNVSILDPGCYFVIMRYSDRQYAARLILQ